METITSEQPSVAAEAGKADAAEPVVPRRSPLRAAIKTGRPKEWIKNFFVFAGLLFSRKFNQPHEVLEAGLTFLSLRLLSSGRCFVNRPLPRQSRRQHPAQRQPPPAPRRPSLS